MSVALMAEHDDAKQASGQCARACGALTRVRRACLWRAQRACATPVPQGGDKTRNSARGQRGVAVCLCARFHWPRDDQIQSPRTELPTEGGRYMKDSGVFVALFC